MSTPEIVDLYKLPPQETFLESYPEKPSAKNTLYTAHFRNTNADGSQNHTIVGVHIVLNSEDKSVLWNALHVDRGKQKLDPENPKVAVRSLQIYCDTLEVQGKFSVPEADVTIFARQLLWATPDAAIDTSPLEWAVDKAQDATETERGKDGAAGRHAGSFQVFVSTVNPANDTQPRLIARGGRGQHPGAGRDGKPGRSMPLWTAQDFEIENVRFLDRDVISSSKATVNFNPPAVYIEYEWLWGAMGINKRLHSGTYGSKDFFPENGTDAMAPGLPGDGGNGGGLTTNHAEVVPTFKNYPGRGGYRERVYQGGAAGTPTSWGKYKVRLWNNINGGTDNASKEVDMFESKTTSPGMGYRGWDAKRPEGSQPKPNVVSEANAWVHHLSLQKMLEYARDLFLAGARDEVQQLLVIYEKALALPMPATNKDWNPDTEAQWTAAQSEIAAMLQRLRGHLDYFGHAAGYMPLLSLAGTIKLYEEETQRALRTLLLAGWIDAKERDVKDAARVLGRTISSLNEESLAAAAQVVSAESKISEITNRIDGLEWELDTNLRELDELKARLLAEAENSLQRQAEIKSAIKMAAALCQLIPVGQPALGVVGSLGSVAADFIGKEDAKISDAAPKLKEVFKSAKEAHAKAKEAKEKAKANKDEGAKKNASAWAKVGQGLGPAYSQVSQGIKALQVPRTEVEAQLQRLQSRSDEWKEQVKKIRRLNERKTAFATELTTALQLLAEGYARISSNAAAVVSLQQERIEQIGRVDPTSMGFVRQMAQRSRLTLLEYLYLMVKSYETTVFKPLNDVNWKLTELTDKIGELLEEKKELSAATLNEYVRALEPIYWQNIETVRKRLLKDSSLDEIEQALPLYLSSGQTSNLLDDLNRSGQVSLAPLDHGLVLDDFHLARLSTIELTKLEFDPAGPPLPETTNLVISLKPARTGIIRHGEALYSVYSDQTVNWTWSYFAGRIRPGKPSPASQDILEMILGKDADKIRQKLALPPLWSDLTISISYEPGLPPEERPRISKLYFDFNCNMSPAPASQRVLKVRSNGSQGGAVIECSPDSANRGRGFGQLVRIYPQGARVRLNVLSHNSDVEFEAWELSGKSVNRVANQTTIEVDLLDHVSAKCRWRRSAAQAPSLKAARAMLPSDEAMADEATATGLSIAGSREETMPDRSGEFNEMPDASVTRPQPPSLLMRLTASEDAPVVGVAPAINDTELVEEGKERWKLVNYRGVTGWVNA